MTASVEIIRHADQAINHWDGGSSTQLAIHPRHARFSDRAFKWRLGLFHIDQSEVRFSLLPGFRRIFMALSGEVRLHHENRYEKHLHALDPYHFDGAWDTTGLGRSVSIALTMSRGVTGSVVSMKLRPGQTKDVSVTHALAPGRRRTIALYVCEGRMELLLNGNVYSLNEKDIVLFHETSVSGMAVRYFFLSSPVTTQVIHAVVLY